MTAENPVPNAKAMPAGAVFHRCALQVNPHSYSGAFRGQEAEGDERSHAEAIVAKAVEIGVSVLAVTDHNSVSGVPAFRRAAAGQGVAVFPGFELSSAEGIHVLCIYPPSTPDAQLGRFLGEFGIRRTDPSAQLSNDVFVAILEKVRDQGGITVAAHATAEKGLLKALQGQPRIKAWRSEFLYAVQIPGSVKDLPPHFRLIVENRNADYRRAPAAGGNLAVAAVNAKDVAAPQDLEDPSATCWIKMSEAAVEGLRQAFLDPGSRIRLASDPPPVEHAELVSMTWEGGFLDRAAFRFNRNLNVLVGGRGAGKSTVIESLRYVLDLTPTAEDARKAHEGIVRQVLRAGTKISLRVRSCRPTKQEYRIERTVPNPPVVRGENGEVLSLSPDEILPRVEVYGQHEISELARSRDKLTRLLDRFVERDASLGQRKAELRRNLEKTRRDILDTQEELRRIDERLAALPGLEEMLKRFQESGLEERLRERSLLVREERVLDSIPERLETFRECLNLIRRELPIDRVFLSPKALEDLPGREILAGADRTLEHLSADLEAAARQLETALRQADEGIAEVRSRWDRRKAEVDAAYQKILRELRESAVDGEEFIRLRREIEALRPLRERQSLLQRLENEHLTRRRGLLAEWEEVKAEEFRRLDRAAEKVNGELRGRVCVEVAAAGDREPLFELLRAEVGGQLIGTIEKLKKLETLSLADFANACRNKTSELHREYSHTPAQALKIAEAGAAVFMRIEELDLPSTTAIRLNTAPAGDPPSWKALEDLSTGQKATAVLLLLLLESDAPLIIDQPEDDLDNRFITEGIVPRMREEKRRRQFIFSTHNANIPVLADAEMILGLTADDGAAQIAPERMGSIDAPSVREMVEEVLEGGKEAFERRRRKYGF